MRRGRRRPVGSTWWTPAGRWSPSPCATSGGFYDCYCTVPGIDEIIPVDEYIAGCPPTPQGLLHGLMILQKKIAASHPTKEILHPDARRPE